MTTTTGQAAGLAFTEEMKGYLAIGESDHDRGAKRGREDDTFAMFHLTISIDDVARFVDDPDREGTAEGWVRCDALGGQLPVTRGVFNLFVADDEPDRRWMRYRLWFADGAGNPLTLVGFKDVHDDPGFDVWRDTSTLFTRILRGHVEPADDATAEVVAAGILSIYLMDFAKQLTTFRTHGPTPGARIDAMTRFGRLFLGELWTLYGDDLVRTTDGSADGNGGSA